MNSIHFDAATERFKELTKQKFFIHPMSRTDADINLRLQEILIEHRLNSLYHILTEYKSIADVDVLQRLRDYKLETQEGANFSSTNLNKNSKFIKMNDHAQTRLQKRMITDYQIEKMINAEDDTFLNVIILNEVDPHLNKNTIYANKVLYYDDEESRNLDVLMLDEKL